MPIKSQLWFPNVQSVKTLCYIYEILLKAVFTLSILSSPVSVPGKYAIHSVTTMSCILIISITLSNAIQYFVFSSFIRVTSNVLKCQISACSMTCTAKHHRNINFTGPYLGESTDPCSTPTPKGPATRKSFPYHDAIMLWKKRMISHIVNTYTLKFSNIFHTRCLDSLIESCWPVSCSVRWSFLRTVTNTKVSPEKCHHTEDVCWKGFWW